MTPPRPLWRNGDFLLLWGGQVVSTLGTQVSALAYPLLVLASTGSPARAGLVGTAQTLPMVLWYLPAGALVDRWERKRVMVITDGVRALALGSVALALALHRLSLAQLLVVAAVEGTGSVFFSLSQSAALPHVVHRSQLPQAVAQDQAREQGAQLAGQPLGGLLFGLGRMVPFLADAVSYLVSCCSLLLIRPAFQEPRAGRPWRGLVGEVGEGVAWLWHQRLLRAIVGLACVINFAFTALTLVLIVRLRQLGAGPGTIGLVLGADGVGAVVGALGAPWVHRRVPERVIVLAALWMWSAQAVGVALAPNAVLLAVLGCAGSVLAPPVNVVTATYRYALAPDRLQARAASAVRMIGWSAVPLASLCAGFTVQRFGPVPALWGLAGLNLAVAVTATSLRSIRRAPRTSELVAARAG